MEELLRALSRHRRRIKSARVLSTGVRWAFYGSLGASVVLAASRIGGLPFLRSMALGLLVLAPVGMAARELLRRFSVRDCAVHLDLSLGLEERLSTAVEGPGAMKEAQVADALGALKKTGPPRTPPLPEAKLLFGSALLLVAILAIPKPERAVGSRDPALAAVLSEEASKLEALASADVEFKEASELARQGRAEEAIQRLQTLREKLGERMLEGGPGAAEAQRLLDQASASASALSAELARLGRVVHAPPPVLAALKLVRESRGGENGAARPSTDDPPPARSIAALLGQPVWNPKYDAVVRRYFWSRQ